MKETEEQSAALKQALKHDRTNPYLVWQAREHPCEADEAVSEVLEGWDTCTPGSYVYTALLNAVIPERCISN